MNELMASDAEVLAWANEQRAVVGLGPLDQILPGNYGSASRCPIANTLRLGWPHGTVAYREFFYIDPATAAQDSYPHKGLVPDRVFTWIRAFDNGEKREYLS